MQQELAGLEDLLWKEHYNKSHYEGGWSTLQLRSINGLPENNSAIQSKTLPKGVKYEDTELLESCPYIKEVLDFFKIEKTAVRLMKLSAGASIKPHTDHDLNFEEGEVRLHVPVTTSSQVRFFLEDEQIPMLEGSCWYLNLSLKHSVINDSDKDRVHLVIDGVVNDWLRNYFSDESHHKVILQPSISKVQILEDKIKIIKQLRLMKTAVADQLADEMEAQLKPTND